MSRVFLMPIMVLLLAACCPAPQADRQQPTAFVGEVVTVLPAGLELRLARASGTFVPVLFQPEIRIMDASGARIDHASIVQGARVSITGFLDAANTVIASEVRVLGTRAGSAP
jgi:hypothetical protein